MTKQSGGNASRRPTRRETSSHLRTANALSPDDVLAALDKSGSLRDAIELVADYHRIYPEAIARPDDKNALAPINAERRTRVALSKSSTQAREAVDHLVAIKESVAEAEKGRRGNLAVAAAATVATPLLVVAGSVGAVPALAAASLSPVLVGGSAKYFIDSISQHLEVRRLRIQEDEAEQSLAIANNDNAEKQKAFDLARSQLSELEKQVTDGLAPLIASDDSRIFTRSDTTELIALQRQIAEIATNNPEILKQAGAAFDFGPVPNNQRLADLRARAITLHVLEIYEKAVSLKKEQNDTALDSARWLPLNRSIHTSKLAAEAKSEYGQAAISAGFSTSPELTALGKLKITALNPFSRSTGEVVDINNQIEAVKDAALRARIVDIAPTLNRNFGIA